MLGDYLFCFHSNFLKTNTQNQLKFCRGLKYFLGGFAQSQEEIEKFVMRCKKMENKKGYLSDNFFKLELNRTDYDDISATTSNSTKVTADIDTTVLGL